MISANEIIEKYGSFREERINNEINKYLKKAEDSIITMAKSGYNGVSIDVSSEFIEIVKNKLLEAGYTVWSTPNNRINIEW